MHLPQFEECLAKELQQIQDAKESFLKNFSHEDYDALVNGWKVQSALPNPCSTEWARQVACITGFVKFVKFMPILIACCRNLSLLAAHATDNKLL